MLKRLYFLFPERHQVKQAVKELREIGLKTGSMHTIAKMGVNIMGLPVASERQKHDFGATLEKILWNLNLGLFAVATVFLFYAVFQESWGLAAFNLLVMAATLYAGNYFVVHVPHTHLDQFQGALAHGEILLMVDVPQWRMGQVERLIRKQHPESGLDGVGWAVESFGT